MSIRTTVIWVLAMLLGLGTLFVGAQRFLPQSDSGPAAFAATEHPDRGDALGPADFPDEASIRSERDLPEAMPFDDSPNLDSWYAEAGSEAGAFDPAPEDKSHLINPAEPYIDVGEGQLVLLPE